MPDFDWRQTQTFPLEERFFDNSIGWFEWKGLVTSLYSLGKNPSPGDCMAVFDVFLQGVNTVAATAKKLSECCLFVSHRGTTQDTAYAERIAFRAFSAGYEYWLDIHDPTLRFINTGPSIQSPVREILIAAIIEMGLLNSSHVIAVMTGKSAGSKWIPYEFGRAKQRLLYSLFSATWLEPAMQPNKCGEYIHLGVMNRTENEIDQWLRTTSSRCRLRGTSSSWPNPDEPEPLP